MKLIQPENIPHFKDILDFNLWYIGNGGFTWFPMPFETYDIDHVTATPIFRHGRFQVELYVIDKGQYVPRHAHPGVNSLEHGGGFIPLDLITKDSILWQGMYHGHPSRPIAENCKGSILFSTQHWLGDIPVTTISARWKGEAFSAKHMELVKKLTPNVVINGNHIHTPFNG